MNRPTGSACAVVMTLCGYGCGGGGGGEPTLATPEGIEANGQSLTTLEDTPLLGLLSGATSVGGELSYAIVADPLHGTVSLDPDTGDFTYIPAADFFGADSFAFRVVAASGRSAAAVVHIRVDNVNDAPELGSMPAQRNSAYAGQITVAVPAQDVDGDPLQISATVDDEGIVSATVNAEARSLTLIPTGRGQTTVHVTVRDALAAATTSFTFTVSDVTREELVPVAQPELTALTLTNSGGRAIEFELVHNGKSTFSSMDQIIDTIRAMPEEIAAEPLERKIWRFVRDNVYHAPPVAEQNWLLATWPTLNSFGWGLCANVAAVFRQIAEAAGYEARIWELTGHVVPEVRIGDAWHMYDPDLAVYYHNSDGTVASVEELAANAALVSNPISPIFQPGVNAVVYGSVVADIYGTSGDNRVVAYISAEPFAGRRISLPASATLTYPGRWTPDPIGYDGATPYVIQQFRQARLQLPAAHTGPVPLPWVLWDVQGTGRVRALGQEFPAGSSELRTLLSQPGASVRELDVIENAGGLDLIFMINALWYDMSNENRLELTGTDVWAIALGTEALQPANQPPPPVPESLRKPRA
ncbi:MAG: hypothetical protein JNK40_04785 [Chromatiales bacterium]|nr:hypothetical protein [Chromatiales bacterium]